MKSLSSSILTLGRIAHTQALPHPRVPTMGWNGWYKFPIKNNELLTRAQAKPMTATGMRAAGYRFIHIVSFLLALVFLAFNTNTKANPVQTVDLSGTWNFTPAGGAAMTIKVPGGGWHKQGFTNISEADYSTTISIPSIGQPQVTVLEFGAVNFQADLFVNDVFVASSVQSFTPATFDITDVVAPGNICNIRVHVKGREAFMVGGKSIVPNAGGWSPNTPQGIFRSAKLLVYPRVHIADVIVRPSVENSNLYYDVWLKNGSASSADVSVSGSLSSWNGDAWNYPALPTQSASLPAGATTKVTIGPVSWDLGQASYWWPNVPYQPGFTSKLHFLNLSIAPSGGGAALHQTSVRFGFRELLQRSDGSNTCYFLNGTRVNFRGDSLQGANYDSILHGGGRGDAFGTLPGFLPGANGWPKAVDNYQRLNYNVVRIHQEPCTPYMLDVCDEKGLMLIEETAIRGSSNDQDFVLGHDHMVNHLKALFTRDRNHPSIVRQSISNEPDGSSTDSTQFQMDLYNAAMSVDGTRPLSVDCVTNTYEAMNYPNFSAYRHYGNGSQSGQYTDEVHARPDRPFGQGEFIWYADNTRQGFAWFATASQAMRAKNASDIRPYTLLSAWASVIPGVRTDEIQIESYSWLPVSHSATPLYGEDNLPNPWSHDQIRRVQAAFHPVLVADVAYWADNKLSNANGDWPANVPIIAPGQSMTRTLTIYNDTLSGTAVDVNWEFRQGSATGPALASGVLNLTVPLGYTEEADITFTAPYAADGTAFYLVLSTRKGGVEMFRESAQRFVMQNQTKLTGTAFGSSPAYSPGNEFDKASDGDTATFFDDSQASGGYTGIDLGAGNARWITSITFSPRAGLEWRMLGGMFRGSNDGTNYTTLYTVTATPSANTTVSVNTYQAYRYLQYVGPDDSYCNIAEMTFHSLNSTPLSGSAFGASPSWAPGNEFDKAVDGDTATYYDYSLADGGYTGIDLGTNNVQPITAIVYTPRAGFEYRMVGGMFQGSSDGTNYTTLNTITATPPAASNTLVVVDSPIAYRYLRYVGPDGGFCNIAEMAFYKADAVAPTISNQPSSLSVPIGNAAQFSVSAESDGALSYQWFKDSFPISGATNATHTLPAAATSSTGEYLVIVTDPDASTISSTATLTVFDPFATYLSGYGLTGVAATADSDHDGMANVFEFLHGGNPNIPDASEKRPVLIPPNAAATDVAEISFRVVSSPGAVTWKLQTSTTLTDWTDAVSGTNGVTITSVPENGTYDLVTATFPASSQNFFVRLVATVK